MLTIVRRSLILMVCFALLAGCATPTPSPTPMAVPTELPTATPVPPTATPAPTNTPTKTPAPPAKIKDLQLSFEPAFMAPQGDNAVFDFGAPALYAQIDYEGMPTTFDFNWILSREGQNIAEGSLHPSQSTGALTFTLESTGSLLPSDYRLTLRAFGQQVHRNFKITTEHVAPGATILTEDFRDNSNSWDPFSDAHGTTKITDGQLQIKVADRNSAGSEQLDLDLADFDLTVDVSMTGSPEAVVYIFFRASALAGYDFSLSPQGMWAVSKLVSGEYQPLHDWERSSVFRSGGVNQVHIIATGDRMAFYLNDVLLGMVSDSEYERGAIRLGAGLGDATEVTASFDNLIIRIPQEPLTVTATAIPQPKATARSQVTQEPQPTPAPKTPPLRDAIVRARDAVEAIGGAMDRIYHGGGGEACGSFMTNYLTVAKSPTYDVSTQPANVQGAYAQYRQGVEFVPASKISQIANICLQGGGTIGNLDFNEARQAVNTAGGLLTQALASLGQ